MRTKPSFWLWWFGKRFLWVIVSGLPAYLLFVPATSEIRFLVSALPFSGKVRAYGIQSEGIGSSGLHGSWTKIIHGPWIDVEKIDSSGSCRISGQLGVFGDQLLNSEASIRQALEQIVRKEPLAFYMEQRTQLCRIKKTVDPYAIVSFAFSAILSSLFAMWAYWSIRNKDSWRVGKWD